MPLHIGRRAAANDVHVGLPARQVGDDHGASCKSALDAFYSDGHKRSIQAVSLSSGNARAAWARAIARKRLRNATALSTHCKTRRA
jgi:hypothetical protein